MKKTLFLLTAILVFACSSDDNSDTNDNNDNNNELLNCDGNPVPTIVYGTQEWTVENACHTIYRDGTYIPQVSQLNPNLRTGAWCYYDNDPTKGILYNWYAVAGIYDEASLNNASLRKEFAPIGWHVPVQDEWITLKNHLISNGYNYDGTITGNKIAKAMASTTGWDSSTETGAIGNDQSLNNSSGFNAYPFGGSDYNGTFLDFGGVTVFWSKNKANLPFDSDTAWKVLLSKNYADLWVDYPSDMVNGSSVRLVKD